MIIFCLTQLWDNLLKHGYTNKETVPRSNCMYYKLEMIVKQINHMLCTIKSIIYADLANHRWHDNHVAKRKKRCQICTEEGEACYRYTHKAR